MSRFSGLVDRPSDRLFIRTIPMSGCMYRRSCYTHFYSKNDYPFGRNPVGIRITCRIYPLRHPPLGTTRCLNFLRQRTAWGTPQAETVSSKNWEAYNLGVRSKLFTQFHLTQYFLKINTVRGGFSNPRGEICWLDLPRRRYCRPLELIDLQRSFTVGKPRLILADQTVG